ncbi:MAG: MBOAT family protein [Bacteroidota bacterium]
MVFSSVLFVGYFLPAFLLLYFASPQRWKNAVALAASIVFYLWGEPRFGLLVLAMLVLDFYLVRLMHYAEPKVKKILLWTVLALNLSALLVYKYLHFFSENFHGLLQSLGNEGNWIIEIALPIGISFITFQKISYALDVYRGQSEPMHRFVDYGLYILLFPQLIAGPIVRYNEIEQQIRDRQAHQTAENRLRGWFRFVLGLSKKLIIANPLGAFADDVFAALPGGIGSGLAWLGIIAYSLQIYYDFSAYSDMAIGIGRMLGFRLPENFQFPYIAESITDFWRRWHITLSRWMRDYLYIPLGGNRRSAKRTYFNLWMVFLLSGLWHGAAWTFVIWGVYHGLWLVLERLGWHKYLERLPRLLRVLWTYMLVLIGWVFFRAADLSEAIQYLGAMFRLSGPQTGLAPDAYVRFLMMLGLGIMAMGLWRSWEERFREGYRLGRRPGLIALQTLGSLILGLWCLVELYATDFNPFIYFRF